MSVLLEKELLNSFDYSDLFAYLRYSSTWVEVEAKGDWRVFLSDKSKIGGEIELALPAIHDEHTSPVYIATALDVLAQLNNEQPETVAERVDKYESDVLHSVKSVKGDDSLPFGAVTEYLESLRSIIMRTSDLITRSNVPFEVRDYSTRSKRLLNQFRFGHTFRSSFGIRLEAPLLEPSQKVVQRSLFTKQSEAPLSRKVLERMIRGFGSAVEAGNNSDISPIVSNFRHGLNANTCKSLKEIGASLSNEITYKVLWSPVYDAAEDVAGLSTLKMNDSTFSYVGRAEEKLRSMNDSLSYEVRGMVKELQSTADPLGNVAKRTVVLKWINRPDTERSARLVLQLDADDYILADRAHINWLTVMVEGEYRKTSQGYVLDNPRNFRIVDED